MLSTWGTLPQNCIFSQTLPAVNDRNAPAFTAALKTCRSRAKFGEAATA